MKKIFYIGGGAGLLLLSILFGMYFAGPLLASASSGKTTATPSTTTTNKYCDQFQQDLANRLNVSVSTLQQDRKAALLDTLTQMVKDGKLTQQQADTIKARIESHQACTGKGPLSSHPASSQAISKYLPDLANQVAQGLHMTVAQLKTQLQSGKSLSDIATAQHISSSQLQTIVTNALQNELKKAVSAGDLTQQQANAVMQKIQQNPQFLNRILNGHPGKKSLQGAAPSGQALQGFSGTGF